jgi:TonB family protein
VQQATLAVARILAALTCPGACLPIGAAQDAAAYGRDGAVASDAGVGDHATPTPVQHLDPTSLLVPPRVLQSPQPVYPASRLGSGDHPTVVLKVTVLSDGRIADASIEHSGGPDFDDAALSALRTWVFEPARKGELAFASRVGVAIHFALPELASLEITATNVPFAIQPSAAVPTPPRGKPAAPNEEGPTYGAEATVTQALRAGASDFQITVGALRLVPRGNAADLLKLAPGILLSNEGGEGHAEQIFMRGFDARAGQDIELTVDGVPINDSGNLHGNGYADTHFIIPELVSSVHVIEGPFSAIQGNYAVAGSADYQLGLEARGATAKLTYGSWDTKRVLLTWAPPGLAAGTFGAVEARETSGFGTNRSARRATAMGQYEVRLNDGSSFRLGAQAYATHFQSAGVVRQDDFESGRVGFFGAEDLNQGGDASRFSVYGSYEKKTGHLNIHQSFFFIRRDMRMRENFTGFLLDTQDALDTLHAQRGDLIDTNFGAFILGGRGAGRRFCEVSGNRSRWATTLAWISRIRGSIATQRPPTSPTGSIPACSPPSPISRFMQMARCGRCVA